MRINKPGTNSVARLPRSSVYLLTSVAVSRMLWVDLFTRRAPPAEPTENLSPSMSPGETTDGAGPKHWSTTSLPSLELLRQRLLRIFPEGLNGRAWAVAEHAAKSVYVFVYALAIEGVTAHRIRPAMVTTMSDQQAAQTGIAQRIDWWNTARRSRSPNRIISGRWYAENSREQIRDETFRVI